MKARKPMKTESKWTCTTCGKTDRAMIHPQGSTIYCSHCQHSTLVAVENKTSEPKSNAV